MHHQSALAQHIFLLLNQQAPLSARDLQGLIGKSQPTISRALHELAERLITIKTGRIIQYSIHKSIGNHDGVQALYWYTPEGDAVQAGTLALLTNGKLCTTVGGDSWVTEGQLPWFLSPLRLEGFLGRLHAIRLAAATGGDTNPERWTLEQTLAAALRLHDLPGALLIGDASVPVGLPVLRADETLGAQLDHHAHTISHAMPPGSSAGGEQPKFLARLVRAPNAPPVDVLVKFSPPHGTPYGDRWADLLHAEALASAVLAEHGIAAADNQVLTSAQRTYLISTRFDRIGHQGRRHVVSIGAAHRGLLDAAYTNWATSAKALAQKKRLSAHDAQTINTLLRFGRLIGNTDMHAGNVSLFVDPDTLSRGMLTLTPVYDMLPMRWQPNVQMRDLPDYAPFEIDGRNLEPTAKALARAYWHRLASLDNVSAQLRHTAAQMVQCVAVQ